MRVMKPWLLCALSIIPTIATAAPVPDWVKTGGRSAKFPRRTHVSGYGVGEGSKGQDQAKLSAAADLARNIDVRIQSEMRDVSIAKDGKSSYEIAAFTSASSNLRFKNLQYFTHHDGHRTFVLAVLKRSVAAAARREQRDIAIQRLRSCRDTGAKQEQEKRASDALNTYYSCRKWIPQALEHEAAARAIGGKDTADDAVRTKLIETKSAIDDRIKKLLRKPVSSIKDAVEVIALQLDQQLTSSARWTVPPLLYGTTAFSSAFGRQLGLDLERALAKRKKRGKGKDLVLHGTYVELDDQIRVACAVRQQKSGQLVAGAEVSLPKKVIPKSLAILPQNFKEAMIDQRLLAAGEEVSGDLRVEVWTNRGSRNLVYAHGEELKIFLRVNQPAYVRLVYLLANKAKVPLEQAYYIDASKVNHAVEYPDAFEVSPPFGVEQLFAVAFTKKPQPLPTVSKKFAGEAYDVVTTKQLVRHRGLKRKKKKGVQIAESYISLTTVPKK